jgi:hypothetical protein
MEACEGMEGCLECAQLRERSASLFVEYVAAREDLVQTRKTDPGFVAKRKELERITGRLRESHRLSDVHEQKAHNIGGYGSPR